MVINMHHSLKTNSILNIVNSNKLINTAQLEKTIEATLISPHIQNERPVSLLIIAKPESGKTAMLKQYRQTKGVFYMTDCTAYGITRDVLPKIVSGEVSTLMIADLLTPLSKAVRTRESFVAFLNNLIEEGVAKITSYANVWDKEVRANVITAVTDSALKDGRHDWAKLGFLSRFILFSYSYDISTVTKIFSYYSEHSYDSSFNSKFKIPEKQVNITLTKETADRLDSIASKIGQQFQIYGIRAKINFRSFLKALAVRNKRNTVTEAEFKEFLELADYMNLNFNPLR